MSSAPPHSKLTVSIVHAHPVWWVVAPESCARQAPLPPPARYTWSEHGIGQATPVSCILTKFFTSINRRNLTIPPYHELALRSGAIIVLTTKEKLAPPGPVHTRSTPLTSSWASPSCVWHQQNRQRVIIQPTIQDLSPSQQRDSGAKQGGYNSSASALPVLEAPHWKGPCNSACHPPRARHLRECRGGSEARPQQLGNYDRHFWSACNYNGKEKSTMN